MKSLFVKLGVMLIGLAIFSYAEVSGEADWKLYYSDELGTSYYDAENITHPSKNIIRVWDKREFTEKGLIEMVKEFGKENENLKLIITRIEINCSDRKMRPLSVTSYIPEEEAAERGVKRSKQIFSQGRVNGTILFQGLLGRLYTKQYVNKWEKGV